MNKRPLKELINLEEPGWKIVQEWIEAAKNHVEVLPPSSPQREEALFETQVTSRSPLGAIVYDSGGLLIDHGWIRILGSGHPRLNRSLPKWNEELFKTSFYEVPYIIVGDDVIGGFYALDNGYLGQARSMFYFVPDTQEWEHMDMGYSDFVYVMMQVDTQEYCGRFRWDNWRKDVAALNGDQGIYVHPPYIFECPAGKERHRGAVPMKELFFLGPGGR